MLLYTIILCTIILYTTILYTTLYELLSNTIVCNTIVSNISNHASYPGTVLLTYSLFISMVWSTFPPSLLYVSLQLLSLFALIMRNILRPSSGAGFDVKLFRVTVRNSVPGEIRFFDPVPGE